MTSPPSSPPRPSNATRLRRTRADRAQAEQQKKNGGPHPRPYAPTKGLFLKEIGMADIRHPKRGYQKVSRAPSCIVRPPTVVDRIVEVPVWTAPTAEPTQPVLVVLEQTLS